MQNAEDNNQRLRETLHFTEDDLAANHAGQLTNSQLLHLIRRTAGYFLIIGVVVPVLFTLFFGIDRGLQLLRIYALGFLVTVPWLAYVRRSVKVVEGKLIKYSGSSGSPLEPAMSHIKVKSLDFYVRDAIFDSFIDGLNYRIFYSSMGKEMVAAERVEPQDLQGVNNL